MFVTDCKKMTVSYILFYYTTRWASSPG